MHRSSSSASVFSRGNRSLRRFAATLTLILFTLPSTVGAAAVDYFPGADNVPVTRGEFLRAVVHAFDLDLPAGDFSLPYKKLPPGLLPYVTLAKQKGAMITFGNDFDAGKTITRIEAAIFLGKLSGRGTASNVGPSFSDVRGALKPIVAIVIEQGWMRGSGNRFGSSKPLRTREAKLIYQVLTGEKDSGSIKIQVPVTRSRVQPRSPVMDTIDRVWQLLNDEYLYKEKLDSAKAGTKAVQGLVNSLNDPYTVYMPPASTERFNDQIKGEIEGIGATVELIDGIVHVVAPIRGSPAEKAGILPKDQILSVDGKSLEGLSLDEAVTIIRGPKGSSAVLKIRRDGNELSITVQRATVRVPEVEISAQGNVTIIRIAQFGQTTDTKLDEYMKDINGTNPSGIILDLRNNPGGLLHAAGVVVGHFLPRGSTYSSIIGRNDTYEEKTTDEPTISMSIPVVVLVNHGSASAAEIVAGALQDAKRATVVGQKTFGKGTVQQVVEFSDKSSLKFTVAEWRTPKGRKIDGIGIDPDIVVEHETARDAELLRALEILR